MTSNTIMSEVQTRISVCVYCQYKPVSLAIYSVEERGTRGDGYLFILAVIMLFLCLYMDGGSTVPCFSDFSAHFC